MSGSSANSYDALYQDLLQRIAPKVVLDIGIGRGKYADLTRAAGSSARLIGIEAQADYLEPFGLTQKYDDIEVRDAADLDGYDPDTCYDLVIIGDCIEHMPKSKALDLLNFLVYRSGYIFIVAPAFAYYPIGQMARTEAHISIWSEHDFAWHDCWAFMRAEIMQLFLLRGYRPAPLSLQALTDASNAAPVVVTRLGGEPLKPSCLDFRYTAHTERVGESVFIYRPL
jgi:SAM-dependent methyltransferase